MYELCVDHALTVADVVPVGTCVVLVGVVRGRRGREKQCGVPAGGLGVREMKWRQPLHP
jgi:hypothetical protein